MNQASTSDLNADALFRLHMAYTHYEFAQECEQKMRFDLAIENYQYSLSYDNTLSFVKEALKQLLQKLNNDYRINPDNNFNLMPAIPGSISSN